MTTRFGTTPDGAVVEAITLRNDRLEVSLLTLGARLNALSFDGSPSLVPSSADVDEALGKHLHSGPVIGPVINRIAGARATLDGRPLAFEPNQDGRHLLHSGSAGSQRKVWKTEDVADTSATFTLYMPDGDGGFPGHRRLTARYSLAGPALRLDILAETDAPTLMNVAHHPYWSLDDTPGWVGHELMVAADEYLPADRDTLPTGTIASVEGTDFDLRAPRVPPDNLDHNYCLSRSATAPLLAARLTGRTGRSLEVWTDAPGLQVFTGKPLGIALEPQFWPDAPHHPAFPSIRLDPGQTFSQRTRYVFN